MRKIIPIFFLLSLLFSSACIRIECTPTGSNTTAVPTEAPETTPVPTTEKLTYADQKSVEDSAAPAPVIEQAVLTGVLVKYEPNSYFVIDENGAPYRMQGLSERDEEILDDIDSGCVIDVEYEGTIQETYPAVMNVFNIMRNRTEKRAFPMETVHQLAGLGYIDIEDTECTMPPILLVDTASDWFDDNNVHVTYSDSGSSAKLMYEDYLIVEFSAVQQEEDYYGDLGWAHIELERDDDREFVYATFPRYAYNLASGEPCYVYLDNNDITRVPDEMLPVLTEIQSGLMKEQVDPFTGSYLNSLEMSESEKQRVHDFFLLTDRHVAKLYRENISVEFPD